MWSGVDAPRAIAGSQVHRTMGGTLRRMLVVEGAKLLMLLEWATATAANVSCALVERIRIKERLGRTGKDVVVLRHLTLGLLRQLVAVLFGRQRRWNIGS